MCTRFVGLSFACFLSFIILRKVALRVRLPIIVATLRLESRALNTSRSENHNKSENRFCGQRERQKRNIVKFLLFNPLGQHVLGSLHLLHSRLRRMLSDSNNNIIFKVLFHISSMCTRKYSVGIRKSHPFEEEPFRVISLQSAV